MVFRAPTYSRSQSVKVLDAIQNEFLQGKRYNVNELLETFFHYNGTGSQKDRETKLKATRYLSAVMVRRFKMMENPLPYGKINDRGQYGVPTTAEEARFGIKAHYKQNKGRAENGIWFAGNCVAQGLLPKFEKEAVMLPKANGENHA